MKTKDTRKGDQIPQNTKGMNNGKPKFTKKPNTKQHTYGNFTSCNDFAWYNQNPDLIQGAAKLSFNNPLGLDMEMEFSDSAANNKKFTYQVPALMVINYTPGIGVSNNGTSNINIAARLAYIFVRHANSGSKNYESPDMMMAMLAIASMHTWYAELVRLYGLIGVSSNMNRAYSKAIVTALGYNYDSLITTIADLRSHINWLAVKINTLAVPKKMSFFDRNAFLPLHIFKDSELIKGQSYAFNPVGHWQWNSTKYDTGSALVLKKKSANMNLEAIVAYTNELLTPLLTDEDIGTICGDILKAFNGDIRQLSNISEDYRTLPVYDEGVLCQIHNMSIVGSFSDVDRELGDKTFKSNDIFQYNGVIYYSPRLTNSYIFSKDILDAGMLDPGVEFVTEATRLKTMGHTEVEDGYTIIDTSGTEIVNSVEIYKVNISGVAARTNTIDMQIEIMDSSAISILTQFDWAPLLYLSYSLDDENLEIDYVSGDLFNFTTLSIDTLKKINDAVTASLFNISGLYNSKI